MSDGGWLVANVCVRASPITIGMEIGTPDVGTVYFHAYRMKGEWGVLEADKGVLVSTDGRTRRLPKPGRGDAATISGDGWTLKAAPGWVVREGTRRGDYELVREQP